MVDAQRTARGVVLGLALLAVVVRWARKMLSDCCHCRRCRRGRAPPLSHLCLPVGWMHAENFVGFKQRLDLDAALSKLLHVADVTGIPGHHSAQSTAPNPDVS